MPARRPSRNLLCALKAKSSLARTEREFRYFIRSVMAFEKAMGSSTGTPSTRSA